jgi:hypothetical protein
MNKQKEKTDFLVNGQPKYANVAKANEQAVSYGLGVAAARLLEQQKRLVEQQSMMQVQQMFLMQKEDELKKLHATVMDSINQMQPPPMPDNIMAEQMMGGQPGMAMSGMEPQGMPQGMPPEMMGNQQGIM